MQNGDHSHWENLDIQQVVDKDTRTRHLSLVHPNKTLK